MIMQVAKQSPVCWSCIQYFFMWGNIISVAKVEYQLCFYPAYIKPGLQRGTMLVHRAATVGEHRTKWTGISRRSLHFNESKSRNLLQSVTAYPIFRPTTKKVLLNSFLIASRKSHLEPLRQAGHLMRFAPSRPRLKVPTDPLQIVWSGAPERGPFCPGFVGPSAGGEPVRPVGVRTPTRGLRPRLSPRTTAFIIWPD